MSLFLSLALIVLLVVISAILSAAEAAFLSVSRAKLHNRIKAGNNKAKLAALLKEKLEEVIATLLMCNNMVNILAATVAAKIMITCFGDAGVAYASISMTIIIVVFAEVVPKFYAMRNSEIIAIIAAYPLKILINFCKPFTRMFEFIARITLGTFGVKVKTGKVLASTTEELRGIIDLHQGYHEAKEERAMLHSVLDLGNVEVSEIMIHRKDIKMLNIDDDLEKLITAVVAASHTRLPVWKDNPDNIIGIIHTKSLLRVIHSKAKSHKNIIKDDILTSCKKPWFIPDTTTLFEQLQAFRQKKEHISLVIDEYGDLQGLVTLEDIIEEIVGDIDDEYDLSKVGFWRTSNNDIVSAGNITIRDLNRHYNLNFPDEEAATIAGLVMHEVRSIPQIGQKFKISGYKIQVLRCLKNQITLIKIFDPSSKNIAE